MTEKVDILIIGAGIVGLSIAKALLEDNSKLTVVLIEKESELGYHASGRNSGVLHAGFYYSPNSLKARFCRDGNRALRELCREANIPVRDVGKVVVTRNDDEEAHLNQLYERGIQNGVKIELLNKKELKNIEPLAVTKENFIWSPTTGVSDPESIIQALASKVTDLGAKIIFGQSAQWGEGVSNIHTQAGHWSARHVVNASGAQADRIAKRYGFAQNLTMIPFMGVYRSIPESQLALRRLVYPVPNPLNPFLGVHFTISAHNLIKIGPTAIPLLNREQYSLLEKWNLGDVKESIIGISAMFKGSFHDMPALVQSEFPKLFASRLVSASADLVPSAKNIRGWKRMRPGIRAQLINRDSGQLINDFLVEGDKNSTHVLNAVSPGWTAAIPFGSYIAERVIAQM